jgi:hypothetical protein
MICIFIFNSDIIFSVCQETHQIRHDDKNELRKNAGVLRPVGDPFLNLVSAAASTECLPLQLYLTMKLDRGKKVFQSKPYRHYELFIESFQRLAAHVDKDLNSRFQTRPVCRVCTNCGAEPSEEVKLQTCSGCKIVCYCSRDCQRQSWNNEHKVECKPMRAPNIDEQLRRMTKRLKLNPQAWEVECQIPDLASDILRTQKKDIVIREKVMNYVEAQDIMDFTIPYWIVQTSYDQVEREYDSLHPR